MTNLPEAITITGITKPVVGAIVVRRCPYCGTVEITHSQDSEPLPDGHAWLLNSMCLGHCSLFSVFGGNGTQPTLGLLKASAQ